MWYVCVSACLCVTNFQQWRITLEPMCVHSSVDLSNCHCCHPTWDLLFLSIHVIVQFYWQRLPRNAKPSVPWIVTKAQPLDIIRVRWRSMKDSVMEGHPSLNSCNLHGFVLLHRFRCCPFPYLLVISCCLLQRWISTALRKTMAYCFFDKQR